MPSIVLISKLFIFLFAVYRRFFYSCFILWLLCSTNVGATENLQAREYLVKAAFLYNFARLSEWPAGTFQSPSGPFKICLMGDDLFGLSLNSIKDRKINGHPLLIQRRVSLQQAVSCQLLFISRSEQNQLQQIIAYLKPYPVLTVSELPDFAQMNGHIRLFLNNESTLSLEINLQAIRNSHLKISSRILTLAHIVKADDSNRDNND